MKIQILAVAGLLLAGGAVAQTQKGNGILIGDVAIGYGQAKVPGNASSRLAENWTSSVSLTAGHFWTDNWLMGVSASVAGYNRQQLSSLPDRTSRFTNVALAVTPFVRRYWPVGPVHLFAGLGLSANFTRDKQPITNASGQVVTDGQQTTFIAISPMVEVGATYFLTNRLGMQLRATGNALPLNTASLAAGLVYWTGPDRQAGAQEERDNPQTNKGNWVVEGSFSVNNQQQKAVANPTMNAEKQKMTTLSVSPSIGYFFGKKNLVGLSIPVTYSSNGNNSQAGAISWSVGLSPYYQHYWTSTRLTPFTRLQVGYSREETKVRATNQEAYRTDGIDGRISIGLAYMAGQRFIIETSLIQASANYMTANERDFGSFAKVWNADLSAGLTGSFAVRYVLR